MLEGENAGTYAIDGNYVYEEIDWTEFLDNEYPALLAQFEETFPEGQLQYF